jgi:hypothetical protein
MSTSSMWRRPAVSTMTVSWPAVGAAGRAARARWTGGASAAPGWTGRPRSGALETDQHDRDRRRYAEVQHGGLVAHRLDELQVNELQEVLLGGQAPEDFLPERLLADRVRELLHDGQRHVGLEERHPDFPERLRHGFP